MPNEEAVSAAIDECIAEGVLEEFLRKERSRVKNVLLYGMTEEEFRETQQNILDKAVADSHADGVIEKGVSVIDKLMLKNGLTLEEACDFVDVSADDYYAYKSKQTGIDFVSE